MLVLEGGHIGAVQGLGHRRAAGDGGLGCRDQTTRRGERLLP